jgi:hypothetical protein
VPEQVETAAMARGTRIHNAIEATADLPDPGEQGCVMAARAWLEDAWLKMIELEAAYAWDGKSGRFIGTGRAAYANAPAGTLMTGTIDLRGFGFEQPNDTVVLDWKTSEQSAAKARPQLMALAVMAEADHVLAVELREDGTYRVHCREEVMPWDREEFAVMMGESIQNIGESPAPIPGDHCADYYCPLRGTCPAYQEAAEHTAELIPAASLVKRKLTAPLETPEDVAHALPLLDMVDEWLEATRKRAKEIVLAAGGEVRLDDKTVWRRVESSRSSVRGQDALELARKLGASQDELAALTYVTKFDVFKKVKKSA